MTTLTAPTPTDAPTPTRNRLQVVLAAVLVAMVTLATVSAVMAWRARDQMYEPDIMLAAFGDLPDDPERAEDLAEWLAEEATAALRLEEQLADVLPFGLGIFAGSLVDSLEASTADISARLIQTEFFSELWDSALPAAHEQFVLLVRGSDDGLFTLDGEAVTVDLDEAIVMSYDMVAEALPEISEDGFFSQITGIGPGEIKAALGEFLEGALPEDLDAFILIESEELASVQGWESQLQLVFWLSVAVAVLAAAGAVVVSSRRPVALAVVAGAVLVGGIIGLLSIAAVEQALITALRDLPWNGSGPSVTAVLNGWTAATVVMIVIALGLGFAGIRMQRPQQAGR
jgi:hypothetical protein